MSDRLAQRRRPQTATLLQVMVQVVFGVPFGCCVVAALRGPSWWGHRWLFGNSNDSGPFLVWIAAGATGTLWLGVRFMLTTEPQRRSVGVLLVLAGLALLVAFHP